MNHKKLWRKTLEFGVGGYTHHGGLPGGLGGELLTRSLS